MAIGSQSSHDLILHIRTDSTLPFRELKATIKRNGSSTTVPCLDSGGNDYDLPGDGIYICISRGGYAKYINANIYAINTENKKVSLYAGLLRSDNLAQNNFGFHLLKGINNYSLLRSANTSPESAYSSTDKV
jgi:hypothetical protein